MNFDFSWDLIYLVFDYWLKEGFVICCREFDVVYIDRYNCNRSCYLLLLVLFSYVKMYGLCRKDKNLLSNDGEGNVFFVSVSYNYFCK